MIPKQFVNIIVLSHYLMSFNPLDFYIRRFINVSYCLVRPFIFVIMLERCLTNRDVSFKIKAFLLMISAILLCFSDVALIFLPIIVINLFITLFYSVRS